MARIRAFFNQQVLLELGDSLPNQDSFKTVSRLTVPDPAGTTTLGEALLILSLAKPQMRENVLKEFKKRVGAAKKNWSSWHSSEDLGKADNKFIVEPNFTRLLRALDKDTDGAATTEET